MLADLIVGDRDHEKVLETMVKSYENAYEDQQMLFMLYKHDEDYVNPVNPHAESIKSLIKLLSKDWINKGITTMSRYSIIVSVADSGKDGYEHNQLVDTNYTTDSIVGILAILEQTLDICKENNNNETT